MRAALLTLLLPPEGWSRKKHGQFVVYCRRQSVAGTRVPAETCYDETGIRRMLAKQAEDREKLDPLRRVCGSQAARGSH
jgi:hypothetical protein